MKFNDIELVSEKQIKFCDKLDLDVSQDSIGVACAKIGDTILKQFYDQDDLGSPTDKQINLARKFKIEISQVSRSVGNAIIDDIMCQLNMDSIRKQKLKPRTSVYKKYEDDKRIYVISSISEDGTVYFKGGNGQRAWARSLENANGKNNGIK